MSVTPKPYLLVYFLVCGLAGGAWGQGVTPPNPTADRNWNQWWYANSLDDVEAEYNAARRAEESQWGLPNGTLGNLNLPSDYLSRSVAEQAWIIVDAERKARAGVNYPGYGTATGMSFEGVETNLSAVSQSHANDMQQNDFFGHNSSDGTAWWQRVTGPFPNCWESVSENIAWNSFTGGGFTYGIPLAFYGFIYDDKACCNWGHRQLCLKQTGNNNYGDPNRIGIVGFARNTGSNGDYFVMDYIDPKPGCSYNIVDYSDDPSCPNEVHLSGTISSGTYEAEMMVESNGTIQSGATVEFRAGETVVLSPNFYIPVGSELTAGGGAACASPLTEENPVESTIRSDIAPEFRTVPPAFAFNEMEHVEISGSGVSIGSKFQVYHAQDALSIDLLGDLADRTEIIVYNAIGELVAQREMVSSRSWTLDIEGWSSGIYLVEVRDGEKRHSRKVVIP